DELKSEGLDVEIVCIAGHRELGIKADMSIAAQLDDLLLKIPADKAILVSDGAEDESVLPILQSRVRVESVKRIVVKQAQNLESTYYIIKELINDPKVARVVFIPAGLTFLVFAIATWIDKENSFKLAMIAIALMIGGYLLYKGFGLDDLFDTFTHNLRTSFQEAKLTFVTYLISLVLTIIAFIQGSLAMLDESNKLVYLNNIVLAAVFFQAAIGWFVIALMAIVIGWIIDAYTEESETLYKYLATPFFLIAMGILIWGSASYILNNQFGSALQYLGFEILASIIISYVGVQFANYVRKIYQYRTVEIIEF
ncbi:MAG TPA: DUF373 family protein, partial [Methanocella sp.]|nr:DUF373 family protein [Methanocella sp.]